MNVESLCGKRAVKGKPGTQGMSNDEIKKFIMDKAPEEVRKEFSRLQKKDRASMCKLLKKFEAGEKLLAASNTSKKPNKPAKKTDIEIMFEQAKAANKNSKKRSWANIANDDMFGVEAEEGELGNVENDEKEGGDYADEEEMVPEFGRMYIPRSRVKERDPLAGNVKLSKKQQVMVRRKLAKAQKEGKLPNLKTAEEQLKFVMLMKPGNVPKAAARRMAPARPPMGPTKRMRFNVGNNKATARIPTRPGPMSIPKGPRLSAAEVRRIRDKTNSLAARLKYADNVGAQLKNAGYTNEDIGMLLNGNMNYESMRERLFKVNSNKAKVLKNLENTPSPKSPPKAAFSMIPGPREDYLKVLKAKKVKDLTPREKRHLRILQVLENKRKEQRPAKASYKLNAPVMMNNNNNNVSNVEMSPVRANNSPKNDFVFSNSNNNSNVENTPKARAAKVLAAERANKAKPASAFKRPGVAKAKAAVRPVVETVNKRTTVNGVNINSMNKDALVKAANRIYKITKPGRKVPFEQANVAMLKKLIVKGGKNLAKK